jgi:hypothetical protein
VQLVPVVFDDEDPDAGCKILAFEIAVGFDPAQDILNRFTDLGGDLSEGFAELALENKRRVSVIHFEGLLHGFRS